MAKKPNKPIAFNAATFNEFVKESNANFESIQHSLDAVAKSINLLDQRVKAVMDRTIIHQSMMARRDWFFINKAGLLQDNLLRTKDEQDCPIYNMDTDKGNVKKEKL